MTRPHVLFLSSLFAISLFLQGCEHPSSAENESNEDIVSQINDSQDNDNQDNDNLNNPELNKPKSINVVSPDWGIAGTLTAMGYPPIATGDMRVWDQWVGKPELPASVTDLGIRYQPNAELVAQLPVDMVIDNYFYEHARTLYGDVPTKSVLFMTKGDKAIWQDYIEPTQQLGQLINQPDAADHYITASRTQIEQAGEQLKTRYPKVSKFAVVQFVDANNMRMYSHNSLFNATLSLMGYELVALDEGNQWGFAPIQLGDLALLEDDVCLLVIEPLSPLTQAELQQSLVWQRLGYAAQTSANDHANSRCMAKLKPIWIYGGMSSMTALADNLAATDLTGGVAE